MSKSDCDAEKNKETIFYRTYKNFCEQRSIVYQPCKAVDTFQNKIICQLLVTVDELALKVDTLETENTRFKRLLIRNVPVTKNRGE